MNWTAILALLFVNCWLAAVAWNGWASANESRRDTKDAVKRAEHAESMKYAANAQAYENRLEADHWKKLHDRILAKNARRSDRAQGTETVGQIPSTEG